MPKVKPFSVLHFPHETTIGGGSIHVLTLMRSCRELGHRMACATLEEGPIGAVMREAGFPVFGLSRPEDLYDVAREWGAEVLHGCTCCGGSYACQVSRRLQREGVPVIGGQHVVSLVGGDDLEADFEIGEVDLLKQLRPRLTVIPYSSDPVRLTSKWTQAEARTHYGIPPGVPVIGRNSRLDASKHPLGFIETLAQLPECWGILSGEGPEYAGLQQAARQLGCFGRLVMPGRTLQPGDVFAAIDIVVYPTLDESWCAGVVEPLLLEKPVVAYPTGGITGHILPGVTGLLGHSSSQLAEAVRTLLRNPDLAVQLGKAGREHLVARGVHDPLIEATRTLTLYHQTWERLYPGVARKESSYGA